MKLMQARREGFALAAAVLAMMVVGAIVTGGFYAASNEHKIATSSDAADMALYIAETGLNNTLATVTGPTLHNMQKHSGSASGTANVTYGGRSVGSYSWRVWRLSGVLFVVQTTGTVGPNMGPYSGATRTLSQVVRVRTIRFDTNAAIQVYGGLTVSGNADVIGTDYVHPSWTGCTPTNTSVAVRANPTSVVLDAGSGEIFPLNSIQRDSMSEPDFKVFGDMTFDEMAAIANHRYTTDVSLGPQPVTTTVGSPPVTVCMTSDSTNWGEPEIATHPCKNFFPIIEAQGSLTIPSNGRGQGILLVRGDLHVVGSLTWYGIIVVLGTTDLAGAGTSVYGTIISYGGGQPTMMNTALGNSDTQYSSCAIKRAVDGNNRLARGTPVKHRAWVDVSAVRSTY